jgi:DNA topoisomerase I
METLNVDDLAVQAGLVVSHDESPGIRRLGRGKGFSYVDPDGSAVDDETVEWIRLLVIPPAWKEVWISSNPDGHILATGRDAAGRKQYIYHPVWEEIRDEVKFDRMAEFGRRIGALRRDIDRQLRKPGLPRDKVIALAIAVLDRTLIRIGNRRYVEENDAYGLTTLTSDHVAVDGLHVHLDFTGKGGADHEIVFRDQRLAQLIARCQELSGETLFSYESESGPSAITSADVNAELTRMMGRRITAKDFRTWGASTSVASYLAGELGEDRDAAIIEAIDLTAEKLGNTRQVCRSSYVHPQVIEAHLDGRLYGAWGRSRRGPWLDRAESTVNRLLTG